MPYSELWSCYLPVNWLQGHHTWDTFDPYTL
jgi:hypothetical protein